MTSLGVPLEDLYPQAPRPLMSQLIDLEQGWKPRPTGLNPQCSQALGKEKGLNTSRLVPQGAPKSK